MARGGDTRKCTSCGTPGIRYNKCPCPKDLAFKFCHSCDRRLPRESFFLRAASHDGLAAKCRECAKRMHAEYRTTSVGLAACRRASTSKRRRMKREVIAGYGGACSCCGERRFEFLSIDHVNNDGAEERKVLAASSMYYKLKRDGFPTARYRLLCMNCNWSRGRYAECPHEGERRRHAGAERNRN